MVRELLGVVSSERAGFGIVVTSGNFTRAAFEFAKSNPISLIDGMQLARMIQDVQSHPRPSADNAKVTSATVTIPTCPDCGSPMMVRKARRGTRAGSEFWGCSSYPRCRGTRALDAAAP